MSDRILSSDELRALLVTFKERYGAEYHLRAIGFFGSYARGEATQESDVDIVFETDAPNLFRTARMREDLEQLFGHPVDVIRLREAMNPRLKARIEQEAVYV